MAAIDRAAACAWPLVLSRGCCAAAAEPLDVPTDPIRLLLCLLSEAAVVSFKAWVNLGARPGIMADGAEAAFSAQVE